MQHHAAHWLRSNLQSLLQCSEPLAFMSLLRINFASPPDLRPEEEKMIKRQLDQLAAPVRFEPICHYLSVIITQLAHTTEADALPAQAP